MSFAQRVQRSPLLLLAVGAVLIVAAVILVWLNVTARRAPAASQAASQSSVQSQLPNILVAARNIDRGAVIGADDVVLRGVAAPAPADTFANPAAVIGRVATANILPSQIIFGSELSASKQAAGVSALIGSGERAFTIKVAEDQIVGGFLRVGDRVDAFVTLPGSVFPQNMAANSKEADQSRATLLLQDVAVLAVGEKLATRGADALSGVRTVTLAVSPEAVARLALADRLGKVALAIRNPSDRDLAPGNSVGLADLGTMPVAEAPETAAAPSEKPKASGHRIIIYSGATTTSVTAPR